MQLARFARIHVNKIKWTEDEILHLLVCMVRALSKLKELGIAHCDIKPANIIITDDGDMDKMWKLVDFGVSIIHERKEESVKARRVGTEGFMAPELSIADSSHGLINPFLPDVYLLGMTVAKLLINPEEVIGRYQFDQDFQDILKRMVETTPAQRIRIDEVKSYLEQRTWPSGEALMIVKTKIQSNAFLSREKKFTQNTNNNNDNPN